MAAFLVDESCPRVVVEVLRTAGHDVRYAAETDRRADDKDLVTLAQSEGRLIITEDFDFGELLVRHQLKAPGAIVMHLPKAGPNERAARLIGVLDLPNMMFSGRLTVISARKVRQRILPP